jgi:hypothetical protein|tara:strand:- start:123 stop:710 length:588 start_codon:yes stop_codon:yes gene_type:complete
MNRLLLILILTLSFQTLVKADDIRDFEIEGMSIGDSLLDFISESEISSLSRYDKKNGSYKSNKFFDLRLKKNINKYSEVLVGVKFMDKSYKIFSLAGAKDYSNNVSDCYVEMTNIEKTFNELFKNAKVKKVNKAKHPSDKSGLSTISSVYFDFPNQDYASIQCFDWHKDMNFWDNLRIGLFSADYSKWLQYEAHK